ncbi:MAG: GntR family transcriptional regulator [Proteobacteria bacterium]|nr:GntR family transcriptional regulator [Pseudomonadota bacterium]
MKLKKGRVPLYHQLERILRQQIYSSKFESSQSFPTDYQICEEFGVSRITVRQALKILEDDGLIRREQGRGTFVISRRPKKFSWESYVSLEEVFSFREEHKLELSSKEQTQANAWVAQDMLMEEGEDIFYFEGAQALFEDGKNYEFVQLYVPKDIGVEIQLGEIQPLVFDTLEEIALETVTQCKQVISATVADERMAAVIKVDPGHPLLVGKHIFISKTNRVLGIVVRHTPGDMYEFINKIKFRAKIIERFENENPR